MITLKTKKKLKVSNTLSDKEFYKKSGVANMSKRAITEAAIHLTNGLRKEREYTEEQDKKRDKVIISLRADINYLRVENTNLQRQLTSAVDYNTVTREEYNELSNFQEDVIISFNDELNRIELLVFSLLSVLVVFMGVML